MKIEINNLTSIKINQLFLKEIIKTILQKEKKEGTISLAIVGKKRIKNLNWKWRKKNKVTTVLSFPFLVKNHLLENPEEKSLLGEIIICPRVIKKKAKREKSSFEKELAKSLIHGVLHLLGFSHKHNKDAKIMEQKEAFYLKNFFKNNL